MKTDDLDVLNLILYSLISKYFWCTGSYSSHVTLRNLFRSLDPESGLSSWSFGSLEGEKKIYNFKNNRARKTNVRIQIYSPWILFVYKAHLSFRQPIRTFFFPSILPHSFCRRQTTKSQKRFLISRPGVYFGIIPIATLPYHQPREQGDVSSVLKRSRLDTPKWMNILLRKRSIYHSV